jgi:predicted alpha/beta superfamily hydrolase
MIKILALLLVLSPSIIVAQSPSVSSGKIKHIQDFPSKFVNPRNIDIWLPEGYNPKSKYAVIYMQDGQGMFDSAVAEDKVEWQVDETLSKLQKEGAIKKCIVVAIWNTGRLRHSEYFPQRPFETFSQKEQDSMYTVKFGKNPMLEHKVQSDNYLNFLVKELKPYIDKNFSTLKDKKNTFIAGSSMGGLISIYAMCEYPDVFGGAACLSTWWAGLLPNKKNIVVAAFNEYLKANLPNPSTHKIYFDYGTIKEDYYIKPLQSKVDSIAIAKGYTTASLLSLEFSGADHSARAWGSRLDKPVFFFLKK